MGALLGVAVLLVPSAQAIAEEDPQPVQWPTIEHPDDGGNSSDPGPNKWITIQAPDADSSSSDPKPLDWPAPDDN